MQIKPLFNFPGFPKKVFIKFHNLLMRMTPLKNVMNLKNNKHQNSYFQWVHLIDFAPEKWKYENTANLITLDHHLIKGSRVMTSDILTSNKMQFILALKVQSKPSSNIQLESLFNESYIDWSSIYMVLYVLLRIRLTCRLFNTKS